MWSFLAAVAIDSVIALILILIFAKLSDWGLTLDAKARRKKILDAEKPCGGRNINVCVAEGCYGEACIKDLKEKL